jgi:hypothetical protein
MVAQEAAMKTVKQAATLAAVMAAGLSASGCVTARSVGSDRADVSRRIADDAVAFNEAYAQAVNGQILLNVLRARDRLPRYYLTTSGISDAPTSISRWSAGIGSLRLGQPRDPWGQGNVGWSAESSRRPSFAVQPFDAQTLTRTVFTPIAAPVFQHYWTSGWPRDLLTFVLVEEIIAPDGARFRNEANDLAADCAQAPDSRGCAFVAAATTLLAAADAAEAKAAPGQIAAADGQCGVSILYGGPVVPAKLDASGACPAAIAIDGQVWTLNLRSFDEAVYYVGELLRAGATQGEGAVQAARIKVRAAGLRGGGAGVPLFRVVRGRGFDAKDGWSAVVSYQGERFAAGPAVSRSCAAQKANGPCTDDWANGDRSSSVLSLLTEILALNQSPDAIKAPTRIFTN